MATRLDVSTLTLQDALDMAVLIESEAEERYLEFADQLGGRYPGDAADFFEMMAQNERKHGAELAERRRLLFGNTPARVTGPMLEPSIEAPEFAKAVRFMSPHRALEIAMESEIKAYEFYNGILTNVQYILEPETRNLIRELRDEEAEHQRLLLEMQARYPETLETDYEPAIDELPAYHELS